MVKHEELVFLTKKYQEMMIITDPFKKFVNESGVANGIASVVTLHTTTGISVNEGLECLENDIEDLFRRLVPEDAPYAHARILPSYGSTAGNAPGHLRALLSGNHCVFPVINGQLCMGEAQDIYFYEFDGPAKRTIVFTAIGE